LENACRLNEFIENDFVDKDVRLYYNNMLRASMLFPVQVSYLAVVYQTALREAYVLRRQLLRETLVKSRKYTGTVKMWVLQAQGWDVAMIRSILPDSDNSPPTLTMRIAIEGTQKTTSRSTLPRNFDGSFEPLRINQDLDFYVKRPTSLIHIDLIHINDDEAADSLAREVLVGHVMIPLRALEGQKMVRQSYSLMHQGRAVAEVKMRLLYNFKEDFMPSWDPENIPRAPAEGAPEFSLGLVGAGQIGRLVLESALTCGAFRASQVKVSTRGPEQLSNYEKLGVSCAYDNAAVAQSSDVLVIAVRPNQLQQVAKEVRGFIRATTLVVSLVSGLPAQQVAALLRLAPAQVVMTSMGYLSESGLILPDPTEMPPLPPRAKTPEQHAAGTRKPRGAVEQSERRAEEARERRRAAQHRHRWEQRQHVRTALRALFPDDASWESFGRQLTDVLLGSLGLPEPALKIIGESALAGSVPEIQLWGDQVQLPQIERGASVAVVDEGMREGLVGEHINDERDEYVVHVDGKECRFKRNRLVPLKQGSEQKVRDFSADGVGNTPDTAEEGFAVDAPYLTPDAEQSSTMRREREEFFKLIGEKSIGCREENEELPFMAEKGGGLANKGALIPADRTVSF
jgi:hypothetical protein